MDVKTPTKCECNKTSIVQGVFGELFPEDSKSHESDSVQTSITGEGDTKLEVEPVIIKSYTMTNANRMSVTLITWGATIVSLKVPDKYGDPADVVLGYEDLTSYLDPTLNQYMGCILGRCANRVKDGAFKIRSKDYTLTKNDKDKHHLNGGTNGFGRHVWEAYVDCNCHVVMSYVSADGEEGYPGAVLATIKFRLTNDNRLEIGMRATTTKPTIVNLSHSSLFNLAGHDAGEDELRSHEVSMNCDRWTVTEEGDPIPTGKIRGVGGTALDLRIPRLLCDVMCHIPHGGTFDHNLCVVKSSQPEVTFVARVSHAKTGRFLEVYSDQPGVHLYTAGRLPPYSLISDSSGMLGENEDSQASSSFDCVKSCDCVSVESEVSISKRLEYLPGKDGAKYRKYGALSIMPQNYPDAVNHTNFPCAILRPGQIYYHDLIYKFGVDIGSNSA